MPAAGRMLRRVGLTCTLLLFPLACGLGVVAVAHAPSPNTVALVEVVRKVSVQECLCAEWLPVLGVGDTEPPW